MIFCYTRVIVFLAAIFVTLPCERAHARSWDLAVTMGHEINFLSLNGTTTRMKNPAAISLTAIAYDDETREMFLSDTYNKNASIFMKDLRESNDNWTTLLNGSSISTHIMGMAYDPSSSSLFYVDYKLSAILKIVIAPRNTANRTHRDSADNTPQVILRLPNQNLQGIALDLCNKRLYWVNSKTNNASIESSDLSGNDRRVIANTDLDKPVSVAVDHAEAKIYWIDDLQGIHYKVERSNLDGSGRRLLFRGRHQEPMQLAVDDHAIYWTDRQHYAIWRLNKLRQPGDEPYKWRSFFENRDPEPRGIIARDNVGHVDCPAMIRSIALEDADEEEAYIRLVTSTEDVTDSSESMVCLNGGRLDNQKTACLCRKGFEGQHCETRVCHNYCIHGDCAVDDTGKPRCSCPSMYRGHRCEQDVCIKFCLNDGECEVRNGEPFCKCKNASGPRCENTTRVEEVCMLLCSSTVDQFANYDRQTCGCSQKNVTETLPYSFYSNGVMNKTVLIILSVIISALIMLMVVLAYFVNKFRRRPRIKKRFVVSKNGITPLTSRPQLPGDQCEIMIENCCNMNICETPCFEPKLRNSEPRISKREEKNSLLQDMEGNNSC